MVDPYAFEEFYKSWRENDLWPIYFTMIDLWPIYFQWLTRIRLRSFIRVGRRMNFDLYILQWLTFDLYILQWLTFDLYISSGWPIYVWGVLLELEGEWPLTYIFYSDWPLTYIFPVVDPYTFHEFYKSWRENDRWPIYFTVIDLWPIYFTVIDLWPIYFQWLTRIRLRSFIRVGRRMNFDLYILQWLTFDLYILQWLTFDLYISSGWPIYVWGVL